MTNPPVTHAELQTSSGSAAIYVVGAAADVARVASVLAERAFGVHEVDVGALEERILSQRPAVVVADAQLEGVTSALARMIRGEDGTLLPVLLIDAPEGLATTQHELVAQCAAVLHRPIDPQEVAVRVEGIVRRGATATEPPTRDAGADESLADESLADESLADEGLADESLADEGLGDEGLADESLADESIADEGELVDDALEEPIPQSTRAPVFLDDAGLLDMLEEPIPSSRRPPAPLLTYPPMVQTSNPPDSSSSPPGSNWPSSMPDPMGVGLLSKGSFAGPTSISDDLDRLLSEAEQRVFSEDRSSDVPTPEEEVNAILPPEVLAALDDPLEVAEDDDEEGSDASSVRTPAGGTTGAGEGTGQHATRSPGTEAGRTGVAPPEPITSTGGQELEASPGTSATGAMALEEAPQTSTGGRLGAPDTAYGDELESLPPHRPGPAATVRNPPWLMGQGVFNLTQPVLGMPSMMRAQSVPSSEPTPIPQPSEATSSGNASGLTRSHATATGPLVPSAPTGVELRESSGSVAPSLPNLPEVLTPAADGLRVLGLCIAARLTASLCFERDGVLCRAVLRDGDFVTCGSSGVEESLLSFLVLRGDMPREVAAQVEGRIPPFGRHAAAALIANGYLGQDQLWLVLRAHAEWLLARMAMTQLGTCALEASAPGRLKAEPAVFGGATGAEVLVDVAQRILPVSAAVDRLGGYGAKLAKGAHPALLGECALSERDREILGRASGKPVREVLDDLGQPEYGAILVALVELGVIEVLPSVGISAPPDASASFDLLDAEAVRKRVEARLAIVQEGDYFELLGVSRSATGYEIRRAYLEARRAFEPTRILTAATVDLAESVQLIVEVLDEAFEIMRDEARRGRYRRALEAQPPPI